jgi:hypothetical protein
MVMDANRICYRLARDVQRRNAHLSWIDTQLLPVRTKSLFCYFCSSSQNSSEDKPVDFNPECSLVHAAIEQVAGLAVQGRYQPRG